MAKEDKKESDGNANFNVKKFNDERYRDFKTWCASKGMTMKDGIFLGMGLIMKGGK